MKKLFYSLLCILILVTNIGCNKKSSEVTAVTTGLSFTAKIICGDIKLVCNSVINNEKSEFIVLSPENIKDLQYVFEGNSASINYKEIEYTHVSTHLIGWQRTCKNGIRHRKDTTPSKTYSNHRDK